MTVSVTSGIVAAALTVGASPYLAALTVLAPDRDDVRWWHWRRTSADRMICTALVGGACGMLAGFAAGWTPDRLVLSGAAIAAVLLTVAAAFDGDWPALLRAAEAAAASFAVFFALALISAGSVGFG